MEERRSGGKQPSNQHPQQTKRKPQPQYQSPQQRRQQQQEQPPYQGPSQQQSLPQRKSQQKQIMGEGTANQAKVPDHPWTGPIDPHHLAKKGSLNLLSDSQMITFLKEGYLILKTALPYTFHQDVYDQMEARPNLCQAGNNILPSLPCVNQIFEDANIKGALTSLLGKNYLMHPHRAVHLTSPGKTSQRWHRDTFWGYGKNLRYNKIRYVMAMYYPQRTTLDIGPTGMKPGTQYYSVDPKYYKGTMPIHFSKDTDSDVYGVVESGSVIFIHYDIIHKGSANLGKKNRYMFKFQFMRTEEPTAPTWNCLDTKWDSSHFQNDVAIEPVCRSIWRWLCGTQEKAAPLEKVAQSKYVEYLSDKNEWTRFEAAYTLAEHGHYEILIQRLKNPDLQLRTNATYALACAPSADVVPLLLKTLKGSTDETVQSVIYILGHLGRFATDALQEVADYLFEPNTITRIEATEAVGVIASTLTEVPEEVVLKLEKNLFDSEGKVRFQAALSLVLLGKNSAPALAGLIASLSDCNRYVQAYAILALQRLGTPEATSVLLDFLIASRWCPLTTSESTF